MISKEERAECRKWCNKHSNIPGSAGYKITRLLDSLEMVEARAEAAERERDALANRIVADGLCTAGWFLGKSK